MKKERTDAILAKRLKRARAELGETQASLAAALGTYTTAIGNYETQHSEIPSSRLVQICRRYNVSADWLLGLDGEMLSGEDKKLTIAEITKWGKKHGLTYGKASAAAQDFAKLLKGEQ